MKRYFCHILLVVGLATCNIINLYAAQPVLEATSIAVVTMNKPSLLIENWQTEHLRPNPYQMQNSKYKELTFDTYRICGNFLKGKLVNQTTVSIQDLRTNECILKGLVCARENGISIVGVRAGVINNCPYTRYGIFDISNTINSTLCYQPKKAGPLVIIDREIDYSKSTINNCTLIIGLKQDIPFVSIETTKGDVTYMYAPLSNNELRNVDYQDPKMVLNQIKDNVTLLFRGRNLQTCVKGVNITADGQISWDHGKEKVIYPNGDIFEGDIRGSSFGNIWFDGVSTLSNGTKLKGEWLSPYALNDKEKQMVSLAKTPTEALECAEKYKKINIAYQKQLEEKSKFYESYIDYQCTAELRAYTLDEWKPCDEAYISYLSSEGRDGVRFCYMTYDKKNDCYWVHDANSISDLFNKKYKAIFALNTEGYIKWVIAYETQKNIWKYYTEFSYYENGVVSRITAYSYEAKQNVFIANFFSDGKLRSAYQYGKGNEGKYVLRRSKEAHPTWGGYTSKLYDLDGNYEHQIEWNISESYSGWSWPGNTPPQQNGYKFEVIDRFQLEKLYPLCY